VPVSSIAAALVVMPTVVSATMVPAPALIAAGLLRLLRLLRLLLRWRAAAVLHVVLPSVRVVVITELRLLRLWLLRWRSIAELRSLVSRLRVLIAILILPRIGAWIVVVASLITRSRRGIVGVAIVVAALVRSRIAVAAVARIVLLRSVPVLVASVVAAILIVIRIRRRVVGIAIVEAARVRTLIARVARILAALVAVVAPLGSTTIVANGIRSGSQWPLNDHVVRMAAVVACVIRAIRTRCALMRLLVASCHHVTIAICKPLLRQRVVMNAITAAAE